MPGQTYAKAYISGFSINIREFVVPTENMDQQTRQRIKQFGIQKPQIVFQCTDYLGEREVGTKDWSFNEKATPPSASHSGLPKMADIFDADSPTVSAWRSAVDAVIDTAIPEYQDDSEESKKLGPAMYLRINRIEATIPKHNPSQQQITCIISAYEDAEYTRQIPTVVIAIAFGTDEYVRSLAPQVGISGEVTDSGLAQLRSKLNIYSLKDFLSRPGVMPGVMGMVTLYHTIMQKCVFNWKDVDPTAAVAAYEFPTILS